jgi:signal transduction histidine kinase
MAGLASQLPQRFRHVPWLVVSLILLILGTTIILVTLHLRSVLRAQIIQQDGIALYAASMIPSSLTEDLPPDLAEDPEIAFADTATKVLEASKRRDVIGARVFDREGASQISIGGSEEELTADQLSLLRRGQTISTYEPNANLREVTGRDSNNRSPLIRALVPLERDENFIGAAEFILDGRKVASSLAKLERDLWIYALLIFVIAGGLTAGALGWAFGRLQLSNALLEERTKSLLRANHELTLSAKTSAVGAITAHLIHDLKSPLFGLQSFVSARGSADQEDWDVALDTTQRMQKVISEIVRILQEERTTENYELTVDEVLTLLRSKLEPQCEKAQLSFSVEGSVDGSLMNRDANIILLLITNVVQNAIQATPAGGSISVEVSRENSHVLFGMRDTGPGLPPHILATLFTPSRSTKSGGSGLGLAISKQLANHIGAELVLKESTTKGTVFQLRVPERVLMPDLAIS